MKKSFLFLLTAVTLLGGCAKPVLHSRDKDFPPATRTFDASPDAAFKAGKTVLQNLGYKISFEKESLGTITTGWRSTKAASHYISIFDREDYSTVGAYYRIEMKIMSENGKAEVEVSAPVRNIIVHRMETSYREEKKILGLMADQLRSDDFEVTNVGASE
jgi:hypothetical protein